MKATRLQAYGGADQFKVEEVADLVPGQGQVLIKVAGSSLNPFAVFLRQGSTSPERLAPSGRA